MNVHMLLESVVQQQFHKSTCTYNGSRLYLKKKVFIDRMNGRKQLNIKMNKIDVEEGKEKVREEKNCIFKM